MTARPLEGIRVVELSIAIAASNCGKYLANFGAEVIKVESRHSPDVLRFAGSAWFDVQANSPEVWADTSPAISEAMMGKRSLGLNLKTEAGAEAMRRLIGHCDVVLTNYSPEAIKRLGLDYGAVTAIRPDIIYCALPGFGLSEDTPYYRYLAWGPNQAPLAALDDLTGWGDRPPSGISTVAYPDYSSALHATVAILAALEHRDATGAGQQIDLSQFEATVGLVGPLLLEQALTGSCVSRQGNRLPWFAPQGVYPCRGAERWVTVTVHNDDEWRALCRVMGTPALTEDPRFALLRERLRNHDALDEEIGAWTSRRTPSEASELLQAAGVPASPVLDTPGLGLDSHLQARDFWAIAPSRRFGTDLATGVPIRLSDTPGRFDRAGPSLGEDTDGVLTELGGYTDEEIREMAESGAIFEMAAPEARFERPYRRWARTLMPDVPWEGEET